MTKITPTNIMAPWFMMAICLVIFVAVFGVMFLVFHLEASRKSKEQTNNHESTAVEIAWLMVPFVIVITVALPTPPKCW
jgi:cytochrome c oxidase subunit 2